MKGELTGPMKSALVWMEHGNQVEISLIERLGYPAEWPRRATLQALCNRGLVEVEKRLGGFTVSLTARPGDRISLQTAPRPVMACGMGEQNSEVQVIGLVPNCEDGARVAIGAGLRQPATGIQMTLCALLDPQQALETSAMLATLAFQAAMLRGEPLNGTMSPELLAMARQSGFSSIEDAQAAAMKSPGEAVVDQDGNAAVAGKTAQSWTAQVAYRDYDIAQDGLFGMSALRMPDGSEWICFVAKQTAPDATTTAAAMPLGAAIGVADELMGMIQAAAAREQAQQGQPS